MTAAETTTKMAKAIRIGCEAADPDRRCSYPDCTCTQIPTAVRAAVAFAIIDASRGFQRGMREELASVR